MDSTPPGPPPASTASTSRTAGHHALENFRSLLMKCAIASTPTQSLTTPHENFIRQHIHEIFPNYVTPDHPPYAWMIEKAVKQLNAEGGSSEEAISKSILAEYKTLPWAHGTLLKHHLRKLCESGNLVESHDGCYLINKAVNSSRSSSHPNPSPSHSPLPSHSSSLSLSLSPSLSSCHSSSSDPGYASTSSHSSSNDNRRKEQWRKYEQKMSQQWEEKASEKFQSSRQGRRCNLGLARGWNQGPVQAQGRGKERSRGRSGGRNRVQGREWNSGQRYKDSMMEGEVEMETKVYMDHVGGELQNLMVEEIADENFQRQQQHQVRDKNQDLANAQSQAEQSTMVIEIDSLEHKDGAHEERAGVETQEMNVSRDRSCECSTLPVSQTKKITSQQRQEPERKRGRPRKKNICPKYAPHAGRGRGRPRKKDLQREETEKNMEPPEATEMRVQMEQDELETDEQVLIKENQRCQPRAGVYLTDGASMSNMMDGEIEKHTGQVELCDEVLLDELIEEVYMEFKEASETENLLIKNTVAEGIVREEQHQLQGDRNSADVECQVKSSTVVIDIEEENHVKNTYEVLEEESQQMVKPEVITEKNNPEEEHCIVVHGEKKETGEFEHCDELRKLEKEFSGEQYSSGKSETYRQINEDHILQLDEEKQAVAEHYQQIEMSKGCWGDNAAYCSNRVLTMDQLSKSVTLNEQNSVTENMEGQSKCGDNKCVIKSDISSPEMASEVKSMDDSSTVLPLQPLEWAAEKLWHQNLQPRPPRSEPGPRNGQLSISSPENSSETNQCRNLRLWPSKSKSDEVGDKAISSSSKPELQKQQE